MMKRRFDRKKLQRKMEAQGFALNLPEAMKNGISFIRKSTVERLFEHVLIHPGEAASAHVNISAASATICHGCVSEEYLPFRDFLSNNSDFGNTLIESLTEAKEWQTRVVDNADAYCRAASKKLGPSLIKRLQPVFDSVEAYLNKLGDLHAIFDREFAFLNDVTEDERVEIDRLTFVAESQLYLREDVTKLASHTVVRYWNEVEKVPNPFKMNDPFENTGLAARLILLVEYYSKKRNEYVKLQWQGHEVRRLTL